MMSVMVNPYRFKAAGGEAASQVYRGYGKVTSSKSATVTLSNVPIGPAATGRLVVVVINAIETAGSCALNSVTIGGVSAKIHVQRRGDITIGGDGLAAIVSAQLNAGTSANIVATFASGASYYTVSAGAFSVTGLTSTTPIATADTLSNNQTAASVSLDVQQGGVVFSGLTANGGDAFNATGITNRYNAKETTSLVMIGASDDVAASQAARTLKFVRADGSSNKFYGQLVAASFR